MKARHTLLHRKGTRQEAGDTLEYTIYVEGYQQASAQRLETIVSHLCSIAGGLEEGLREYDELLRIVLRFEVAPGLIVTERAFWHTLADCTEDVDELLLKFLLALHGGRLGYLHPSKRRLYGEGEFQLGAIPLYTLLDRVLPMVSIGQGKISATLGRSFFLFLEELCDLEEEFEEDQYIESVLGAFRHSNTQQYFRLLNIRLLRGNSDVTMQPPSFFIANLMPGMHQLEGLLKRFVDYGIQHFPNEWNNEYYCREGLRYLVTAIYGDAEEQIEEVISYVSDKLSIDIPVASDSHHLVRLASARHEGQAYLTQSLAKGSDTSTGFHTYDPATGWKRIGE